jgi:tripartite ATP-independent transporter DctP family solute receptor
MVMDDKTTGRAGMTPDRGWRRVGAAGALLIGVLALTVSAAAREFRAADIQEENYPTVQALRYLNQLVTERTGGRHRIRVFHSRQLGEENQTIDQTRVGAIDMNRINVGAIGNYAPMLNLLATPFLFRSIDHLHRVIDGPIGDEILSGIEANGFVGLTFYDSGARSIYTSNKAVRDIRDLRGMRLRVQQSAMMDRMVRLLGAEPITIAYGQVLTALQTKLVDGAENNWPSYVAAGHYKVAHYYSLTRHIMGPEVVVMSPRAWSELSVQDRGIFREAARDSSRFMRTQWLKWEAQTEKQARDAGVQVIDTIDRKPFRDATAVLRDELSADPKLRSLIERIDAVP